MRFKVGDRARIQLPPEFNEGYTKPLQGLTLTIEGPYRMDPNCRNYLTKLDKPHGWGSDYPVIPDHWLVPYDESEFSKSLREYIKEELGV